MKSPKTTLEQEIEKAYKVISQQCDYFKVNHEEDLCETSDIVEEEDNAER